MKTNDIIILSGIVVAGVAGYLIYTKQIGFGGKGWGSVLGGGGGGGSSSKSEETDIVKSIAAPIKNIDFSGAQDFISDAFDRGDSILKGLPKDIIDDAFKRGSSIVKPTIRDADDVDLDDLISGAFKGNPFKPYPGTKYRPYD